ncbi:MAG: hypothetical protein AAB676_10770 [Verrucomicrobiota bacterium]
MKQLIRLTLNPLVAVGLMILVVGCNKSYKTILGPEENITQSSAVEIDGRADAGKIKHIYVDASGQRVAEFSSDSEPLRQGTIRIRGNGVIVLRTEKATGEVLQSGALIPVESSLGFAAKQWGTGALAILAVAAVAAVICLRRFLAFQAAAPFIPLLLAAGLALLTAYSAHGLVVPIVLKIQAKAQSSNVPATSDESASSATGGGWANKAKHVERDFIGLLRTPADAPRLLAFILTFVVTLPIFASLIAWLFRKLAHQPAICGLLLLAVVPSALNAAPSQTGVFYSRDFLRDEQRFCQQSLTEVERDLTAASRLLDSNLAGAPEHLVRALFLSDLVGIRLEGQPNRISQLKSSLGYTRTEEQRKLNAVYAGLRQQLQTAQLDAAKLGERCNAATNATTALQVFQAKQGDYRNLIRAGLADVKTVLEDCNRQVIQAAQARKAEPKPQENEKTAADLARLQHEQIELQNQLSKLRRGQDEAATQRPVTPRVVVVTNEVRTVIEKLVPTPAPPPVTNKVIQYVTNTVRVLVDRPVTNIVIVMTNSSQAPSVGTTGTNAAMTMNETNTAAESDGVVVAEQGGATSEPKMPGGTTALLIGLGILIAIAVTVWMVVAGDRTWVVRMATNGEGASYEVQGSDRLVLGGLPHAEHHAMVNGQPHIRPTWKGAIIHPGVEPVVVNGAPILKPQKLNPSDRITAQAGSESTEYDFLDYVRATEQLAED